MKKLITSVCLMSVFGTSICATETYVKLRPRIEVVDATKSATAITNRLQVGVRKKSLFSIDNLNLELEATQVTAINEEFDTGSDQAGRLGVNNAVVADPAVTNFTKAFVQYKYQNTRISAGENPINLGTQRFIGSVDWRQMPQTFGNISITQKLSDSLSVYSALLYRRNGITPELNKRYRRGSGLLHGTYTHSKQLMLSSYFFQIEDTHNTYGIQAKGTVDVDTVKVTYLTEFAHQTDPLIGDTDALKINSNYYNLELGAKKDKVFGKIGFESLGDKGSGTKGFSTPYATGHKFNGWSDVLLGRTSSGSNSGLRDLNLSVGYGDKKLGTAKVVYHKFTSVTNSINYGSEIDFLYKKPINDTVSILFKTAIFEADEDAALVDTKKYWLMGQIAL